LHTVECICCIAHVMVCSVYDICELSIFDCVVCIAYFIIYTVYFVLRIVRHVTYNAYCMLYIT